MNNLKGIWRFIQPIRNYFFKYPIKLWISYSVFIKDWILFKRLGGILSFRYIAPYLTFEKEDLQTGGGHYFYQDIWALKKLVQIKPKIHYDIGSRFDGFVGQATAICEVVCIDLRSPSFKLDRFSFIKGDILKLPFPSNSINSLSCLHTIEHIGLGRYGDAICPDGFLKALEELQRVVAFNGHLILSMPIGKERIEFNAQRILDPLNCIDKLNNMKLIEFSVVTDDNNFIQFAKPLDYQTAKYSCGLYHFVKIKD